MNYLPRRMSAAFLALAISLPVTCSFALANGSTGPTEVAKYFNPFQKKHGDLNKSQDRIIKKKAFKADELPDLGAQPAVNRELGFFAIVPPEKLSDPTVATQLLDDARVNGLSVTVPWSLLEPKEDEINWQPIDQLLALCQKSGKTMILRVSTAGVDLPSEDGKTLTPDTPKWVFEGGGKSVAYETKDGKQHVMPLFWDKDYMGKWSNFIRELASKYDKNPSIHSIGITGGGFLGGTSVLPADDNAKLPDESEKSGFVDLEKGLKAKHGMTQRQLVEHWKYISELFPKRFPNARLNFDINPPVPHRYGEDALDEISDYLVYRYGERIYLTRQGAQDGKHGFDDYRVLIKFRNDTLTGLQFTNDMKLEDLPKIAKHALDDGISFAELPAAALTSVDPTVQSTLKSWSQHIGYQLISQKASVQDNFGLCVYLKATFTFMNVGAASALRPEHIPNFDKDNAASYRLQIELRDAQGKPVLQNVHTPPTPTTKWAPGQAVTWEQDLKMVDGNKNQLPPGEYTAFMSLVDSAAKRKITFLNATSGKEPASTDTVEVGKVVIAPGPLSTDKKLETSSSNQGTRQ